MQSISSIISQTHITKGEIPPPLVGSSISVVGDLVFVFAGRLVTSRKMTNRLYILDLNTLEWSRHIPPPDSDKAPKPRYFHSTSIFDRSLVVFGGMGYSHQAADGLCVLDDVAVFEVDTMSWRQPTVQPTLFVPRPRYAHLATISDHYLYVIGGQDMNNGYLNEINVLDLHTFEWVQATAFHQHVGTYRSVALATPSGTPLPTPLSNKATDDTRHQNHPQQPQQQQQQTQQRQPSSDKGKSETSSASTSSSTRHRMSILYNDFDYRPPADTPGPIFLYSNHNFADVNRELQLLTRSTPSSSSVDSPPLTTSSNNERALSLEDVSGMMTGAVMPPGLRFPTGEVLGDQAVISGTYLSPQGQHYSLWGLNIATLAWTRIDTGNILGDGSWNRGVLYRKQNRYLVFGNTQRNLLEDYNNRLVNFEHLASIDLEAFGIYSHPKMSCSPLAQEMGLRLLNEPAVADFYIITRESQEIPVNSAILRYRWPYFAKLLLEQQQQETKQSDSNSSSTNRPQGLPAESSLRRQQQGSLYDIEEDVPIKDEDHTAHDVLHTDIGYRTNARYMTFPYAYPVVTALLQYLYTDNLLTTQQYQPHILSQLLLLADIYNMPRLVSLATHALHQILNMSTAPLVFETAALSHQTSLQVRALKLMINAKKMVQQHQHRTSQFPQQHYRLSQYNYNNNSNNGAKAGGEGRDWDTVSTASATFQQSYMDQYQPAPTPTASLSFSYQGSKSSESADARQTDLMSPTLGPYRSQRSPSIANPSVYTLSGSRQSYRPSTAMNHYASTNVMSPTTIPEDDTFSVSSYSVRGKSTLPSASISPSSSSTNKDTVAPPKKRKDYRFLNKFSLSKS